MSAFTETIICLSIKNRKLYVYLPMNLLIFLLKYNSSCPEEKTIRGSVRSERMMVFLNVINERIQAEIENQFPLQLVKDLKFFTVLSMKSISFEDDNVPSISLKLNSDCTLLYKIEVKKSFLDEVLDSRKQVLRKEFLKDASKKYFIDPLKKQNKAKQELERERICKQAGISSSPFEQVSVSKDEKGAVKYTCTSYSASLEEISEWNRKFKAACQADTLKQAREAVVSIRMNIAAGLNNINKMEDQGER